MQFRDTLTEEQALDLLSAPSEAVGHALAALGGPVVLLGASGKIGPTMSVMARRSLDLVGADVPVIGVARFSDPSQRDYLEDSGVRTVTADLADPDAYADLPDAAGLYYLVAQKFGTTGAEHTTWWSNAAIPTMTASRYRGVPSLVYSTGNVYPLRRVVDGGSTEQDPVGPVGEYAQSSLARERVFAAAGDRWGTPVTQFRLNYACEVRYGVVSDIARLVAAGEPVDVTMPAVNVVWQGDVSAWALRAIEHASAPPTVLNATGPETVPVARIARLVAQELGVEAHLVGEPSDDALLADAGRIHELYGYPGVPLHRLVRWTANWIREGGRSLDKPTKFQQREGAY